MQVRTILDMDEKIVALAKLKATEQGKSLDALVEEGLRAALQISAAPATQSDVLAGEPLEPNDPFFSALEDIRSLGRQAASRRAIGLTE